MNRMQNDFPRVFLAATLLASLLLAGCAATVPQDGGSSSTNVATDYEIEPWDGDGMEIPLDGSSMEAWNRSLARVRAHVDEPTYTTLENAIDYLLVYDIGAKNSMPVLITRLNGMTGYDILSKIRWRAPRPGAGPAEKDSRDASLIDRG